MLPYKFGMFTVVIHLSENMRYDDFVCQLCNKWKNLSLNMVYLTYALHDHPKCLLDNDLNLLSLSMLASSMGMERVNVFVSELQESKDEDREDDGVELAEDNMALVDYEGIDI